MNADRCDELLALLAAAAVWVEPTQHVSDRRDAKDNRYLELALAARATVIVSGDADLLVLDPWRGVRILTPAQFLETPLVMWSDIRSSPTYVYPASQAGQPLSRDSSNRGRFAT